MYAIDTTQFQPPSVFTEVGGTTPSKESSISALVHDVIKAKQANLEKAKESISLSSILKDPKAVILNLMLVGGDLFSMGYLVFQGVTTSAHILPLAIGGVAIAGVVLGIVAGAFNIAAALLCLKEGLQALANKDYVLSRRLFFDFAGLMGIGIVMILVPLKIACLTASLAANPWILPFLFFVITIPLLKEIGSKIINIYMKQDLASTLKLDQLSHLLKNKKVNWNEISLLYKGGNPFHFDLKLHGTTDLQLDLLLDLLKQEKENLNVDAISSIVETIDKLKSEMSEKAAAEASQLVQFFNDEAEQAAIIEQCQKLQAIIHADDLIERMENLQADMGVIAGIEAMKLFECLLKNDQESAITQCEKLQEKITEWNDKQHMRMLQQFLFVVAFVVCMAALRFPGASVLYNSIVDFFMAGANAIPLYMDIFWLFERNTTLVVPMVELNQLPENKPSLDAKTQTDEQQAI